MLSLAQEHFRNTQDYINHVPIEEIANWLLKDGYFPEQYVLPPCFHVEKFTLQETPYYKLKTTDKGRTYFNPKPVRAELINVFFPKSRLTDRIFGIVEPQIYHDIVWDLLNSWDKILNHLFHPDIRIFSYSFPIPVSSKTIGNIGKLRSGRMIYEFIGMTENDLVADAHRYQYYIKTDIKKFYPTIYTHSLAWAIEGKKEARGDTSFGLLGNRLDKLFQTANDKCTNGLAIGPVISDLAAEIILASIDRKSSTEFTENNIDFLGVRFKDDYKIFCQTKNDADQIIKTLQRQMRLYNLSLNESKTEILELPNGLFRPAMLEYNKYSLRKERKIPYKTFERTLLEVLKIDEKYPGTALIQKFLSELISSNYLLKLDIKSEKQIKKLLSLLFMLKRKQARSLPGILAIIELIIEHFSKREDIKDLILGYIRDTLTNHEDYLYDAIWIAYFLKSQGSQISNLSAFQDHPLFKSIYENKQSFFSDNANIDLFIPIEETTHMILAKHLAIFPKESSPENE